MKAGLHRILKILDSHQKAKELTADEKEILSQFCEKNAHRGGRIHEVASRVRSFLSSIELSPKHGSLQIVHSVPRDSIVHAQKQPHLILIINGEAREIDIDLIIKRNKGGTRSEAEKEQDDLEQLKKKCKEIYEKEYLTMEDLETIAAAAAININATHAFHGKKFQLDDNIYIINGFQWDDDGQMSVLVQSPQDITPIKEPWTMRLDRVWCKLKKKIGTFLAGGQHPLAREEGESLENMRNSRFNTEKLQQLFNLVKIHGSMQTWEVREKDATFRLIAYPGSSNTESTTNHFCGQLIVEVPADNIWGHERYVLIIGNTLGFDLVQIAAPESQLRMDFHSSHAINFNINTGAAISFGMSPGYINTKEFDLLFKKIVNALADESLLEKSTKLTKKALEDRLSKSGHTTFQGRQVTRENI